MSGRVPPGEAGGAPAGSAPAPGQLVIVGRVRKPQGLHGELLVEPITDAPEAAFSSGRRLIGGTAEGDPDPAMPALTVRRARPFKKGYIIGFVGLDDRTAAGHWRGRYLLAELAELPALAADEVYRHELLGMNVSDVTAGELGTVSEVYDLPHGLLLGVRSGDREVLIPYRPEMVQGVDRDARRIDVALPPGLLE